jgi:hypothetical protein
MTAEKEDKTEYQVTLTLMDLLNSQLENTAIADTTGDPI